MIAGFGEHDGGNGVGAGLIQQVGVNQRAGGDNSGDRPIQVGSHFHFFEVNRALEFDRAAAFGLRLNIPSSTATRFEPGDERDVQLVPYGGKRAVYGFNNLVDGPTAGQDAATVKSKAVAQAAKRGFRSI